MQSIKMNFSSQELHELTSQILQKHSSTVLYITETKDLIEIETLSQRLLFSASKLTGGWHVLILPDLIPNLKQE